MLAVVTNWTGELCVQLITCRVYAICKVVCQRISGPQDQRGFRFSADFLEFSASSDEEGLPGSLI